MGKGKAKPRARSENSAKAAAKREARRAAREAAGLPPKNTHKKSRRLPTAGINLKDLKIVTPADRAKEALSHVKWTALFKKHLGILESHIKTLDRVVDSLRTFMRSLPEEERKMWERGDVGNWGHICGLVDRARETLCGAKEASKGILTEHELRDKKGLGVKGTTYEKLYPAVLAAKEAWKDGTQGLSPGTEEVKVDGDGDSEMEDAPSDDNSDSDSSSESDSEVELAAPHQADEPPTNGTTDVESNPYFVVDTKPTPVTTNIPPPTTMSQKRSSDDTEDKPKASKKSKKELDSKPHIATMAEALSSQIPLDEAEPEQKKDRKKRKKSSTNDEDEKAKKETTLIEATAAVTKSTVDFAALQAKLQAEVDIGDAAKDVEASGNGEDKKQKKKRRRSSTDGLEIEKEGKKVKKEKKDKKRKAEEAEDGDVKSRKRKA